MTTITNIASSQQIQKHWVNSLQFNAACEIKINEFKIFKRNPFVSHTENKANHEIQNLTYFPLLYYLTILITINKDDINTLVIHYK